MGLWPQPSQGEGPWEVWPRRAAVPSGAARDAMEPSGPVGVQYPPPPALLEAGAPEAKPSRLERYRYMHVQTHVVKVRCVPLWQDRMLGMLAGAEEDAKAQDRLVRNIKSYKPQTRAQIVRVLMDQLNALGKGGGAVAGRLAKIKVFEAEPEGEPGDGPEPGDTDGAQPSRRMFNA
jgi:hypothetical protein